MVFQPRLLLVYLVVFLYFNPQFISTQLLSSRVLGKISELDIWKSWLPEKANLKKGQEGTERVHSDEKILDKKDEHPDTQEIEQFLRRLENQYTKIMFGVLDSQIEKFKRTLNMEFLKAVSAENGIRRDEDQSDDLFEVYIQFPMECFLDREKIDEIQSQIVELINRSTQQGIINGLIFEASSIQELQMNDTQAVILGVKTMKTFLSGLDSRYGYKFKLGLSVNSLKECGSSMKEILKDITSLFDWVVYNYKHDAIDTC